MDKEELLRSKIILIVEDEEIMREAMASWVSKMSHEVHTANNGKAGLEMFHEVKPDVVITDIEMPVMNGIKMIDAIKDESPLTQVVIVTAFSDEAHNAPRADAVLVKPLLKNDLKDTLLGLM